MIAYLFLSSYLNKRPHLKGWYKVVKFLLGVWVFFNGIIIFESIDYSYTDQRGNTYVATEKTYFLTADRLELAKFNASGSLQWSKKYSLDSGYARQMIVDEYGNIFVALSCDPGSQVVKFNPEGKLLWKRKTSLDIRAMRIIENKVIALGCNDDYQLAVEDYHSSRGLLMRTQLFPQWIYQTIYNDEFWIDSGGNVFTFPRNNSILNKMTPAGQRLWKVEFDKSLICSALGTDAENNLYLGGSSKKPGNTRLAYLARIDADGNTDWSQEIELDNYPQYTSLGHLSITGDKTLYAIGEHQYAKEGREFKGWHRNNITKLYLLKMTLDGQIQWHTLIDLPDDSYLGTDGSGNAYLVADVLWSDSLGLAKYDANGERQWMSVTLSADRIYTILVIIVAVMDSVLKWLAKRRKKTRINPYTGIRENCYDEYRDDYRTDPKPQA